MEQLVANGMAEMVGTSELGRLLEETRHALATLAADDLEELAVRAEGMLQSKISGAELVHLTREHRLLNELLLATKRNISVLCRNIGYMPGPVCTGEAGTRWER